MVTNDFPALGQSLIELDWYWNSQGAVLPMLTTYFFLFSLV